MNDLTLVLIGVLLLSYILNGILMSISGRRDRKRQKPREYWHLHVIRLEAGDDYPTIVVGHMGVPD